MLHMQQPTCRNIRIRSTLDAHKIFYAVQQGILHMVTRRLDADERLALGSGCVYAWEERGPHTEITGLGIERFTEGRRWSPSRVRDEFLFYYEKYSPPDSGQSSGGSEKSHPPRDWDPLVKQTYSVWVETDKGRRKWHLTAYFTQATVDHLGTIDDIAGVGDLMVPDGMFKSTRVNKNRSNKPEETGRSGEIPKEAASASSSVTRTYAPFPSPFPPTSTSHSSGATQSVQMYEPYPNASFASYTQSPQQHTVQQYSATATPRPAQVPAPNRALYPNAERTVPSSPAHFNGYGQHESVRYVSPSPRLMNQATGPSGLIVPSQSQYDSSLSYTSPVPGTAMTTDPHVTPSSPLYTTQPMSPAPQWYDPPVRESFDNQHSAPYPTSRPEAPTAFIPHPYQSPSPVRPVPPSITQSGFPPPSPYSPSPQYNPDTPIPLSESLNPLASQVSSIDTSQNQTQHTIYLPSITTTVVPRASYSDDGDTSPSDSSASGRSGEIGPRRDLAPLHSLKRNHPYRRDPVDDKTLRLLDPRPVPTAP